MKKTILITAVTLSMSMAIPVSFGQGYSDMPPPRINPGGIVPTSTKPPSPPQVQPSETEEQPAISAIQTQSEKSKTEVRVMKGIAIGDRIYLAKRVLGQSSTSFCFKNNNCYELATFEDLKAADTNHNGKIDKNEFKNAGLLFGIVTSSGTFLPSTYRFYSIDLKNSVAKTRTGMEVPLKEKEVKSGWIKAAPIMGPKLPLKSM